MRVIDADGHVEENPLTFSDKYFDPAFRAHRPVVVPGTEEGLAYWMIDEQLFPRRVGRGCNNLGTPASINGKPVRHAQRKPDTLGSMELTNLSERLADHGRGKYLAPGALSDAVPRLSAEQQSRLHQRHVSRL